MTVAGPAELVEQLAGILEEVDADGAGGVDRG
jgi:myo-inositol-1(or 4)-monophosphatase